MRILHTADWHIGQTLNGWNREAEHAAFLESLGEIIAEHEVDALLVAGDVFDSQNPSGEAQRLLYRALAGFLRRRPGLTVVMTAGNHDPAQRLEAPEAVLRALGVHVVGTLQRDGSGVVLDRHLIPLCDASGTPRAHVLAVPYLRASDFPGLNLNAAAGEDASAAAMTRALHLAMVEAALPLADGLPLLAMGHLTCAGGLESEGAERRILIGGDHAVPPDVYPAALAYVALGHLHRPQNLDGGRLRYAGSPLPLSKSERAYQHGVTLIEIDAGGLTHRHLPLPRPVSMLQLPASGALTLPDLEAALQALALDPGLPVAMQPFLYIDLHLDHAVPVLLAEMEALIARFPLRLAGVQLKRPDDAKTPLPDADPPGLAETSPGDLFCTAFQQTHGSPPDPRHLAAFHDILAGV